MDKSITQRFSNYPIIREKSADSMHNTALVFRLMKILSEHESPHRRVTVEHKTFKPCCSICQRAVNSTINSAIKGTIVCLNFTPARPDKHTQG